MKKPEYSDYNITEDDFKSYNNKKSSIGGKIFFGFFLLSYILFLIFLVQKPLDIIAATLCFIIFSPAIIFIGIIFLLIKDVFKNKKRKNLEKNIEKFKEDEHKYFCFQHDKLDDFLKSLNEEDLKKEIFRIFETFFKDKIKKYNENIFVINSDSFVSVKFINEKITLNILQEILEEKNRYNINKLIIITKNKNIYPEDINLRNKANTIIQANNITVEDLQLLYCFLNTDKIDDFINDSDKYSKILRINNFGYFSLKNHKIIPILKNQTLPTNNDVTHNLYQIYGYNYNDTSYLYYLIDELGNIISIAENKMQYKDGYWINQNIFINDKTKKIYNNVRLMRDNIFYICETETHFINDFDKLEFEYKEATLLKERQWVLGSTGELSLKKGCLEVKKHCQYKFMDENYNKFYTLEISPNFYIDIKNNKFAVIQKTDTQTKILVNYGIYDFIAKISKSFLLVSKANTKHLNDETSPHYPKIPIILSSIIDKFGSNCLNNAWYRYIEILNDKEVKIYSGSSLEKYKIYNIYTQEETVYGTSVNFLDKDTLYYTHNEVYFNDNVCFVNKIINGYENIGTSIFNEQLGVEVSKTFGFIEYFNNDYCIVFDMDDNQYCFVNENGDILLEKNWLGADDLKIFIENTYWFIKQDNKIINTQPFDCIYPLINNVAIVKQDEEYGIIDKNSNQIINCEYTEIVSIDNKFFIANNNNTTYYLFDSKGKCLFESDNEIYSENIIYTDNIITFPSENKVYSIDGEIIVSKQLPEHFQKYHEKGYNCLCTSSYEIHEIKNNELLKWYANIKDFSEEYAVVFDGNNYGYIDKKGIEVIPCQYQKAFDFANDLAVVVKNNEYHIINKNNEIVF